MIRLRSSRRYHSCFLVTRCISVVFGRLVCSRSFAALDYRTSSTSASITATRNDSLAELEQIAVHCGAVCSDRGGVVLDVCMRHARMT